MKNIIFAIVFAFAGLTTTQAQTLQVDPIYVGGDATFNITTGALVSWGLDSHSRVRILQSRLTFFKFQREGITPLRSSISL